MEIINLKQEIKNNLDENIQYRELLFRRGYLLTSQRLEHIDQYPFYNIWSEVKVGELYLYVHNQQTFYIQSKSSRIVIIIGHAYNPFDMKYNENDLCLDLLDAYQKGINEYFEKISEFTGLHVIFMIDNDRIIGCQDACSLTGCYFSKKNNNIYISEHPQLIADLLELKIDSMVKKLVESKCYNIGNRHLPGNKTPYKEIKRLGANTYVEYNKEFHIKRFYPTGPHPEYETEKDKKDNIEEIADLIHKGIELCAKKWNRCAISLSGGVDSKTTLACANGLYDKFSYFSFFSKEQELVDAKAARQICNNLGLKHTIYQIPENNNEIKDFQFIKKILQHNTSYFKNLADNEVRKYIYLHDLDAFDVELKSWASEVARVFLERKYQIKMPKVLTERHCSIFQTRYFGHPSLLIWSDKEYYRFLREIGLEKPLFNYEHADLFYWEVRMGAWGVSVTSSQQLYHRVTMPMNNRKILEKFLCMPHEDRKQDKVHKAIMYYENPEIVKNEIEVPNLYFHGYRILMEKIYYRLRTLFYKTK